MKISSFIEDLNLVLNSLIVISNDITIKGYLHFTDNETKDKVYIVLEKDYKESNGFYSSSVTFQSRVDIEKLEIEIERNNIREKLKVSIFYSIEHFLERSKLNIPEDDIYIYKENSREIIKKDSQLILEFKNYLLFVDIIKEVSDIKKSDFEFILYSDSIKGTAIEIDRGCLISDNDGIARLNSFRKHIDQNGPDYSKEFNLILKDQICEISNRYKTKKISRILEHFNELQIEVMRNFHMFLSNFSFQKIKNTYIQEKSKYIEILDKYVSTVQNVVFSIPISVGITLLIKNIDSNKIIESMITLIAFIFYTVISIIIIKQNKASVSITEEILKKEKIKLYEVATCNGMMPEEDEFKIYFDLFTKKIKLVKILSIIIIVTLIVLSLFFALKLMVSIPVLHGVMRKVSIFLEKYTFLKPIVLLFRFIY